MADKPPAPVVVANPEPIAVQGVESEQQSKAKVVAAQAGVDARVLKVEDQRRISGIWERTQQIIALSVVETALIIIVFVVYRGDKTEVQLSMTVLFGMVNLVIGFYFGRTNHTRVGGGTSTTDDTR